MINARVRARLSGEDANDAAQEVLAAAAKAIMRDRFVVAEGVDVTGAVRGWLTVILKRVCRTIRGTDAREERTHRALRRDEMFVDPIPLLEAREELRHVPRGLTKRDCETLSVYAQCGGSLTMTAAEMGRPSGTIGTRLRGVRRHLKKRRALDK